VWRPIDRLQSRAFYVLCSKIFAVFRQLKSDPDSSPPLRTLLRVESRGPKPGTWFTCLSYACRVAIRACLRVCHSQGPAPASLSLPSQHSGRWRRR
jgi:hypothetical protein